MKNFTRFAKPALLAAVIFTFNSLYAQNLIYFGTTTAGGAHDSGAIVSFNPVTDTEQVVYSFAGGSLDGSYPQGPGNAEVKGDLVYDASSHLFYGMTATGGTYGTGTIFSFDPATNVESLVWSFGRDTDGATPYGNLVYYPANGLFYGMTSGGGGNDTTTAIYDAGAIISFNPVTHAEQVVWSFGRDTDGTHPQGTLVYDPANSLFYGMTADGGSGLAGTIISFNPATNAERMVSSFLNSGGREPWGDMVYNTSKNLFYGMTFLGGTQGNGIIFSFNTATNTDSALWNFQNGTDGLDPMANFVYDAGNGLYYATTNGGGTYGNGAIITFNPATNAENVVVNFGNYPGSAELEGNLVYDANNGLFYGMAPTGGVNDTLIEGPGGTIFSFDPASDTTLVQWNFASGTDGFWPNGDLVPYNGPTGCSGIVRNDTVNGQVCGGDTFHFNGNGYNVAGTYIDTVTTVNGCDSLIATIQVTMCIGINNISSANTISVYPNPANDRLTITGLNNGQIVVLYNYLGQKTCSLTAGGATQQMDISAQANGIYLIQVLNADGTVAAERKIEKIN